MITFASRFPATWLSETWRAFWQSFKIDLQTGKCWGKNKYVIYLPRSVRIGKNCALSLEYGPRPQAADRGYSFSLYRPPGR